MGALSKDVVIRLLGDANSAVAAQRAAAEAADVSVAAYRRAEREMAKQQKAADQAHARTRELQEDLGRGAMVAGTVVLAGFGMAVQQMSEFEVSMSAAAAATMATAQTQDQLRSAALEAGASTSYSATEAADAITELAKAGVGADDILGGGLAGALDLAAAGQLDVATAAEIAATQMSVFGLSGQATSHVADLLAAGAGKAQGSVQDLAGALKYVGPVAAGMGVSIEETTGALAMFASKGIVGEQAGTSLRGVISALSAPSEAAATTLQNLGISVFDAQGNFIGLAGVAGQLHGAMSDLTEEERSAALGRIFGNEQLTAARVLYEQGSEGVKEWTRSVNDAGFAQEQAAKLTDNLKGDVERLGGALSTAFITGGSGASGALRFLTEGATSAVEAFSALPDPVEGAITAIAGIAGAGAVAIGGIATVSSKVGEFRDQLNEMGGLGEQFSGALGTAGQWAAKAGAIGGVALAVWGLSNVAADLVVDFLDLDDGASDVADALAEIDIESVQTSLLELGDSGRSVGWLAEEFGSVRAAVETFNDAIAGGHRSVDFRADIQAIDAALSGMMGNGQIDEAAAAFARLGREQIRQGESVDDLLLMFPQFGRSLQDYVNASTAAEGSTEGLTAEQQTQLEVVDELALNVDGLKDSLDGLNGITQDQYDAEAQWTESLGNLRDEFEAGRNALDRNTEAGAENWGLISRSVDSADDLALAIFNTTGSYDAFAGSLQQSREKLADTLIDMGVAQDEAWALTDSILQIPPNAPTTATMNTDPAAAGRDDVLAMIDLLNITPAVVNVHASANSFWSDMNAIVTGQYNVNVGVTYTHAGETQGEVLDSFFAPTPPHRAAGGSVWPGQTFLVGEEGPELVRFGSSGYVTPAGLTESVLGALQQPTPASSPALAPPPARSAAAAGMGVLRVDIDYSRLGAAIAAIADRRPTVGQIVTHRDETGFELAEKLTWTAATRGSDG